MEERKRKEIKYYDKQAEKILKILSKEDLVGDFEGFEPFVLSSYKFFYDLLAKACQNKKILDYGCGNGIHSIPLAKMRAKKVIGIDLSGKSLEIARVRVKKEGVEEKIEFQKMDCEKMDFPDNFFDIVFDSGTFSSIDLKRAYPELKRVLKPNGFLIGIETFGHNPFTNLKRKINKITGKRTRWAVEHIFKMKDLKFAENYFNKIEINYFHLISWLAFPILELPGGKLLLRFLEILDRALLHFLFLKKYAFKVVFVFKEPGK